MRLYKILLFLILFFSFTFFNTSIVNGDTISDLKNKIAERNNNIKELEEEIKKYQVEIESLGREADSLKNTLASLDLSKKKIEANLRVTQNKIETTNLEIKQLSNQIEDKSERIGERKRVISQSLSTISQMDSSNIIFSIFGSKSLSDIWESADRLNTLQASVQGRIQELETIKTSLEDNKKKTEVKKRELVSLQNDLSNQKKVLAETVRAKNSILAETKNTEANYKKILSNKRAQKDALEKEILEYESALRIAIDPNLIPNTGSSILSWPLSKIKIPQYFGNTPFSTANPQIYSGKGHTGIDFASSIGTPVYAALGGVVTGVHNTDAVRGCYSYGKWIMIEHANGLSTLYAHLSLQTVARGQTVSTGQVIGYSGNTGYSTGPHLHFGVYATQGVRITLLENSKNCKGATIPLADLKAYLNPLSFL